MSTTSEACGALLQPFAPAPAETPPYTTTPRWELAPNSRWRAGVFLGGRPGATTPTQGHCLAYVHIDYWLLPDGDWGIMAGRRFPVQHGSIDSHVYLSRPHDGETPCLVWEVAQLVLQRYQAGDPHPLIQHWGAEITLYLLTAPTERPEP